MMSLLLSSVSASAITAGGPPAPTGLLTYVDHGGTGTDNTAISLSFPEVGFYVVGVGGSSGGAGSSDSPITLTTVNGEPITQLGTFESSDYEEVTFGYVFVGTPGTYAVNFTYSSSSYRRYSVNWKAALNADLNGATFYGFKGIGSSQDILVLDGDHVCLIGSTRSGTIDATGVSNVIQASALLEGTDFYFIRDEAVSVTETKTITDASVGTTSTRLVFGALHVKKLPDNLTVYGNRISMVVGGSPNLAMNYAPTYVIHGFSNTGPSVLQQKTYVILE